MRKILILNGAGKKNGNTAALIKSFREGAESSGHEIKEFFLQNMNIHGCMDCQGCARKPSGDPQPCVQKDDMQQVYEAFAECDVVVFATPVYWFTVSGQLKLAVDRLYAVQRNHGFDACKKETVFLMTSGAPAEMNPQPVTWYNTFEQMGWKSLGMALNDMEEARRIGSSI
jgi:multimeric flavodoxin WrbA